MIRLIVWVATAEAVRMPVLPLRYGTIEYTASVPVTLQNRDLVQS
jgi:hypothetical protein